MIYRRAERIYQREALLDEIKERLSVCAARSYLEQGKLSDAEEELFRGLLNIVLGCELKNMNLEKRDFPAVDLGDDCARIAVQITSTGDRTKVMHTLAQFAKERLGERFSRLIVLVVGKKDRGSLPQSPEGVSLEWWSLLELVDQCKKLPYDMLERVGEYLRDQVGLPQNAKPLCLPLETLVL